jgi:hypothetical protein
VQKIRTTDVADITDRRKTDNPIREIGAVRGFVVRIVAKLIIAGSKKSNKGRFADADFVSNSDLTFRNPLPGVDCRLTGVIRLLSFHPCPLL